MPTVNQRIPNFLGGVSQQPDKIKFPGQVRVCDNAVPDITFGLKKRPAGEFVKTLTNANGTGFWYEILRDGDEKYIVQMTPAASYSGTKPIRIWDLSTGVEQSLTNSNGDSLFQYMQQTGTHKEYSIQTIQDYTIICNPQKTVGTTGNTFSPIHSGDYSYARLDTVAYNTEYILYSGTAPAPNTYFRVTSVKVDRIVGGSAQGPTFDDTNEDQSKSGTLTWSFSGGSAVNTSGAQVGGTNITENIEGSLQVNGNSFIANNTATYQGNQTNDESKFLGYIQDYDVRYTATVTLQDGGLIRTTNKSTAEGLFIDISLEGETYRISVEAVEPVTTYRDVSGIAYFKSPKNPDNGVLSMATILRGLKDKVNSDLSNVTAEVIGSGLFMHGSAADGVNFLGGAVNENMSVIGQKAQDISRLPAMCKHGYVAQIANTADLDVDDYYVEFIADNGVSGAGSWEECVRPHNFSSNSDPMIKGLDPATMPHALINNRNGTFTFVKLDEATANSQNNENYWKDRVVGDNASNPFPTFNGAEIQEIFFHRNRLGFIAGENIVMSRPGGYFNFFIVSAISTSDDNPIDITVSDIKPAFINHTLPIQKGLLMFSDNGQFLLFTESDIFSPKTARLKKVASYECDSTIQPVDLGTSVLFTSNVSAYARAFEATILDDDTPPNITEQTRVVPEFLPKDITKSANSVPIGIVTYGKKGDTSVYHYKYYNAGQRREQSAWYSWTLTGTMQHILYTGGSFFTVTLQGSDYILSRYEYVADANATRAYVLGGTVSDVGSPLKTARWFEPCLDNLAIASVVTGTAQTTTSPEKTVLTIPYTPTGATNFFMIGISGNDSDGNSIVGIVRKADSVTTNSATFNNINISSSAKVAVGYSYTSIIELPTYYLNRGEARYDTDGELRISGLNFELGVSGPMQFKIIPTLSSRSTYTQFESGMLTNNSNFNSAPATLSKSVRVPIQAKNEKYTLQIQIPDPFSTALLSASWDGNYNEKRHVRR